jgi:uncharacterized protein YjgD (DUF1641 family)
VTTTIAPTGGLEARLDRMAAQLDELTAEMHRTRAQRDVLVELVADAGHVTGPAVQSLVDTLQVAQERGYVDFARGSAGVLDRIVTHFDEDDVEALGDNVVLILETVKEMTQPEVMTMLRRTAHRVNAPDAGPAETPSLFALLREMRDPQVRRGLARLLDVLRSLADDTADTTPPTPTTAREG